MKKNVNTIRYLWLKKVLFPYFERYMMEIPIKSWKGSWQFATGMKMLKRVVRPNLPSFSRLFV